MRYSNKYYIAAVCLAVQIVFLSGSFACAATIPTPAFMALPSQEAKSVLEAFQGIPYRNDGAIDTKGQYTLFADEGRFFSSSGLNCSGFVLGASRFLLKKNITVAEAKKDRFGDSGPGALGGEDWDFGWDLILNISEGFTRSLLAPDGTLKDPSKFSGTTVPVFDLHSKGVWASLLGRMQAGNLYLITFQKGTSKPEYPLLHYHVALVYPDEAGNLWMYQTTTQSKKVYSRKVSDLSESAEFLKAFANTGKFRKKIAVIEVLLPR